jgi:hypothetical protein
MIILPRQARGKANTYRESTLTQKNIVRLFIQALLERVVKSGKHISLMAHFSHPAELSTPVVREAIRRLRATGIQIRCQAPLINHINNDSTVRNETKRNETKRNDATAPPDKTINRYFSSLMQQRETSTDLG